MATSELVTALRTLVLRRIQDLGLAAKRASDTAQAMRDTIMQCKGAQDDLRLFLKRLDELTAANGANEGATDNATQAEPTERDTRT